jgi:putative ABC transport system permease protein
MNLIFNLKYAWRLLIKSWGYSLMCASVVALSVGLGTWAYEIAYSQVLKPLDFPGSDRWYSVQVGAKATSVPRPTVDAYTYQEILERNRSAHYLGAYAGRGVVLSEGQASTTLRNAAISPQLFAATRVAPLMGRVFQETDGQTGAARVAILSYNTWQTYFAGDRNIVGRTARIDSAPVQIVGVMPKGFYAFQDFELWTPLNLPQVARPGDSTMTLSPFIVLDNGKSPEAILSEMKGAVKDVNRDYPDLFNAGRHVALFPAKRMFTHDEMPVVVMLSLMAAGVLLLGCVNISMVFLARLLERSRELALRTALGASRGRLIRQCLLETALIVVLGLLIGFALAAMGLNWTQGITEFGAQIEAAGRDPNEITLRPMHLVAAVVYAGVIWLLSTIIPAWRIARQDPAVVLAGTGKGATIRGSNRSVRLLVGVQVVVSCIILVLCGNLVLAVNAEVHKPTGLNTAGVIMTTAPTAFDSRHEEPAEKLRYWEDLTAAIVSKVPGAQVAYATAVPTRPPNVAVSIETQQGTTNQGTVKLPVTTVSEDYFKLLGLTARSGRLFDSTETASSLNVAVVDEQMAARYWPNQNAEGKRVQLNPTENGPWLTIIGVVSSVVDRPYQPNTGVLYRPLRQALPSEFRLLMRAPNAGGDTRVAIRAAAFGVDRDLPLHNLQTLDDYLAAVNLSYTALIPILLTIAVITALMAASGLFGLISRSVAQRTQEVGIRRALGATSWRSISVFMRQAALYLAVAVAGVAVGVMLMPMLSATIQNIFVHAFTGTVIVVLLMAAVIFFASYLPSRRAIALEPGDALRYE